MSWKAEGEGYIRSRFGSVRLCIYSVQMIGLCAGFGLTTSVGEVFFETLTLHANHTYFSHEQDKTRRPQKTHLATSEAKVSVDLHPITRN